jgi:hypothetical protein
VQLADQSEIDEEIKRQIKQIETEQKARRRKAPPWNPDTEPPWRLLEDIFSAALKSCEEISTRDLETVLGRGEVPITGTRSDILGDFLPVHIEKLVAAAERRLFHFASNSILATYREPPDREALFGPKSTLLHRHSYLPLTIRFDQVRGHWPKLVEVLQEAGFEIRVSATPKQTRSLCVAKRTTSSPLPRPTVSALKFRAWYEARVKEHIKRGEQTSEDDDWKAARNKFGKKVRRQQVRDLRPDLVPAEWRIQGRRSKTDQNSAK